VHIPFDKITASVANKKGIKKKKPSGSVRGMRLHIAVSLDEFRVIDEKAAACGQSRAELIVRAVKAYEPARPQNQ